MTDQERRARELAEAYPRQYEIMHMNADTPMLSGAEYLKHGFIAGYLAAANEPFRIGGYKLSRYNADGFDGYWIEGPDGDGMGTREKLEELIADFFRREM